MHKNNKNDEDVYLSDELKKSQIGINLKKRYEIKDSYHHGTSKIIQWVIKYSGGLVKDEKQANYILIGFAALSIIILVVLIFGGGISESSKEEQESIMKMDIESRPQIYEYEISEN